MPDTAFVRGAEEDAEWDQGGSTPTSGPDDMGGMPDLVADGRTGLLAPSGDVEALAGHVVRLLQEPERARALALAGQESVLSHFGVERLVQDMESLYTTVLKAKGIRV